MPKVVDREARQVALGQAALAVFAERGYHRATMQDVADRAGVSKGSVYDYFQSKDALLLHTARWLLSNLMEASFVALEEDDAPIARRLEQWVAACLGHLDEWTEVSFTLLQVWAEMGREDEGPLRGLMTELYAHAVGRLQAVLDAAVARGELSAFDTRSAAVTMLAAFDGAVLQSILLPVDLRRAVESGVFTRLCLALAHAGGSGGAA